MTPIFTVHAGEYLVGTFLEKKFRKCRVWIPSKDSGVDLLLTNASCSKAVSIQVKFSRDYVSKSPSKLAPNAITRNSFFTLNRQKIKSSPARYWVFVLHSFSSEKLHFVVVPRDELLKRLGTGKRQKTNVILYFSVVNRKMCWELRGLGRAKITEALESGKILMVRDFSRFLDSWEGIKREVAG